MSSLRPAHAVRCDQSLVSICPVPWPGHHESDILPFLTLWYGMFITGWSIRVYDRQLQDLLGGIHRAKYQRIAWYHSRELFRARPHQTGLTHIIRYCPRCLTQYVLPSAPLRIGGAVQHLQPQLRPTHTLGTPYRGQPHDRFIRRGVGNYRV